MAERAVEIDLETVRLSKIDVAKSQLCEAIMLFFEQRDPVSVHTLSWAALEIIHEHLDVSGGQVDSCSCVLHYNNVHIKNEYKKFWAKGVRRYRNYFKHANFDKDNKIDFNPKTNEIVILESIMCLNDVCGVDDLPEVLMFVAWASRFTDFFTGEFKLSALGYPDVNLYDFSSIIDEIKHMKLPIQLEKNECNG